MIVAILVICYVLFLRYLDKKNREQDRRKAESIVSTAPADFATIKRMLADLSQRLASLEKEYYALAQRGGGAA